MNDARPGFRYPRGFCAALLLVVMALTGCGGSDDDATAPGDSASALIGPAGGRVATPGGAEVVVPAGALAAPTTLAIARSAASAPALPAGFMAAGEIFAFTPHGTAFAMPVTVSVPVDASRFPAGLTPTFYKTNAAGAWERIPGATLAAGRVTAQVSGFSWFIAGVPPQIAQQPQDATVAAGASASFSVTALGMPPFSYLWQSSIDAGATWDDIAGATSRTYTTPATTAGDNGKRFRVVVDNPDAQATSQAATLTVTAPIVAPAIATQPANASVGVGAGATFTVVATGTSLLYRWQISRDGGAMFSDVGGAGASHTHVNAQLADHGALFRVVVSNGAGSVTSANAMLSVGVAPPPPPVGSWLQLGGTLDVVAANPTDQAAVALDRAGNPVVAWAEYGPISGGATGIRVARWDGANWIAVGGDLSVFQDPNLRTYEAPSIAIDPTTGHPLVAWSEARNGLGSPATEWDVIVKRWNGSAWERLGTVLNVAATEGARVPKLRVTNAGTPIVAWWETPHFTFAKRWDGAAWVAIGGQNAVGSHLTGAQDRGNTALTIDGNGDPIVMHGSGAGLLAARGTGAGWTYLGFPVNGTPATSYSWGAAVDSAGRPLALIASGFDVRARRFENGAWADLGAPLQTLNLDRAYGAEVAVLFGTPTAFASWYVLTTVGQTTTVAHRFRLWDGFAWQAIAADLPHYCQVAVRSAAAIAANAAPVAACVRGVGAEQDIVVYRLVP